MSKKLLPFRTYPTNTPYPGAYVEQFDNGTTKLYINSMLIVSCPYGSWYWKTPAYTPRYAHIHDWFMQTYFPGTKLCKSVFRATSGMFAIVPIKTRKEATVL